jgi:hypothetical protein
MGKMLIGTFLTAPAMSGDLESSPAPMPQKNPPQPRTLEMDIIHDLSV